MMKQMAIKKDQHNVNLKKKDCLGIIWFFDVCISNPIMELPVARIESMGFDWKAFSSAMSQGFLEAK